VERQPFAIGGVRASQPERVDAAGEDMILAKVQRG